MSVLLQPCNAVCSYQCLRHSSTQCHSHRDCLVVLWCQATGSHAGPHLPPEGAACSWSADTWCNWMGVLFQQGKCWMSALFQDCEDTFVHSFFIRVSLLAVRCFSPCWLSCLTTLAQQMLVVWRRPEWEPARCCQRLKASHIALHTTTVTQVKPTFQPASDLCRNWNPILTLCWREPEKYNYMSGKLHAYHNNLNGMEGCSVIHFRWYISCRSLNQA